LSMANERAINVSQATQIARSVKGQLTDINGRLGEQQATDDVLRGISGYAVGVSQGSTTNHAEHFAKGKYSMTITADITANFSVFLYKSDPYVAGDESNVTVINNKTVEAGTPKTYNFEITESYEGVRIWQNKASNASVAFTQIGSNTEIILNVEGRVSALEAKGAAKEVTVNWSQKWFYDSGETASTVHTDGVATEKLTDSGLYLITFPDTLTATYNVKRYEDASQRRNIDAYHPFSKYCGANDFVRVIMKRKDGGELLPTDSVLNEVKIYLIDGITDSVTVAAADTNPAKKENANIILDGTNDTRILAALVGCYDSIDIKLYDGTYTISEFYTFSATCKIALPFNSYNFDGGTGLRRYISVEGGNPSSPQAINAVKIYVAQALHESMAASGINYFLIGAPYSYGTATIARLAVSCRLKNINVIGYKYDKPITYVDTTRCLSSMLDSVNIRSWAENIASYAAFADTPNMECCGIRVGRGSNYGIQNFVKHLNVWYCGKGIACNGEHFIFEDVKAHHCYIGWYFGDKNTVGHFEHTNIMLGCSIESCYRLMVLSKNGETVEKDFSEATGAYRSSLIVIGLSTERTWHIPTNEVVDRTTGMTKPILEIIKGAYNGRVEAEFTNYFGNGPFEPGSCRNMGFTIRAGSDTYYRTVGTEVPLQA